ncbi:MAG: glutamate formimidoyltransferase [bacterium]
MIIECVPNISEGRDVRLINTIVKDLRKIRNLELRDVHYDYDHNRSVFTLIGDYESVFKGVFKITQNCLHLDINFHEGVHPCAGIIDVVPFVPIKGISYDKLKILVEQFAYEFFKNFGIPVYLYALSSKRPTTSKLATIRNKGINFIKSLSLEEKEYLPDIFENQIFHPTLGVTFIGVRYPLIAFNFNIKITDAKEEIIKKVKIIAKELRESSGGIKNLQALVFFLASKNMVQLSTNILEAHKTDFLYIFDTIKEKLDFNGLKVDHCEIVGCLPSIVVSKIIKKYLRVKSFDYSKIVDFTVNS